MRSRPHVVYRSSMNRCKLTMYAVQDDAMPLMSSRVVREVENAQVVWKEGLFIWRAPCIQLIFRKYITQNVCRADCRT